MRLASILPRASLAPVAVAAAPDGTWIELAALTSHRVSRLEEALPWVLGRERHLVDRAARWRGPRYRESEFEFLPPIVRPAAFRDFDAFEKHVKTLRSKLGLEMPQVWYEAPIFHFANRLALVGQHGRIWAPLGSSELDFGLALGVVIGRSGRDIRKEKAWEHVAGFTIINDLSARDLERKALSAGLGSSKGKDFATAVGPWLVLRSEFETQIQGEALVLRMSASVNGRVLCRGNTNTLYHSIPSLVTQASRDAELFPGDLLCTGSVGDGCLWELTDNGHGRWLSPGDQVELEIECIGKLTTRVVERPVCVA